MTNGLLIAILQWCSSVLLVVLVPLMGWTLKQVHRLRADFEGHKGAADAEIGNIKRRAENDSLVTDRRFDELREWVKSNGKKLDTVVARLNRPE